jgi:hypothetical protein
LVRAQKAGGRVGGTPGGTPPPRARPTPPPEATLPPLHPSSDRHTASEALTKQARQTGQAPGCVARPGWRVLTARGKALRAETTADRPQTPLHPRQSFRSGEFATRIKTLRCASARRQPGLHDGQTTGASSGPHSHTQLTDAACLLVRHA